MHLALAIGFGQFPRFDDLFGAGGHFAQFAGNFDLLRLRCLGQVFAEVVDFLATLATAAQLFLSFATTHGIAPFDEPTCSACLAGMKTTF